MANCSRSDNGVGEKVVRWLSLLVVRLRTAQKEGSAGGAARGSACTPLFLGGATPCEMKVFAGALASIEHRDLRD